MKHGFLALHPALFTGNQALVLTLLASSSAAVLSLAAAPLTQVFPFSLFFLAVAASAWLGGVRQGLLSLVLALFFVHFFLRPLWGTPQGLLRAGLWLVIAGSIAFMLGKLRGFQSQAQTVLANIGEGVVILDQNWNVVYINEAGAPCATLSPREMIGRSYWDVAPEASGSTFEQHIRRCARESVPVQFEMRTPRRQRWLHVRAYPLPDGVCCFAQDITEAKERETRLRAVLERLSTAQKAVQMGTWEWNLRTNETFWSEDIPGIHGISAEQFDGKLSTWIKTVHPEDVPAVRARIRDALKKPKEEYYAEFRVVRPNGEIRWVCSHGRVLVDKQGRSERMIGVTTDITQRRLEEEALRRSEKLAATGRLAASIAHEINNPLAAVTNLLYLMRNGHNKNEYLRMAEQEVARISHLVKQTLSFYRASPNAVPVNLADLIEEVVGLFRARIRASGVNIETHYRCKAAINGFSSELSQVFGNLIGNALDAMQPGGTLRLRTLACQRGLRVTVADNGCGISPGSLGKIFQPFFTANKEGGTGLGLWLAKEIVEKHGGAIRVRSSIGSERHGTVFMIWLPPSAPVAAPESAA
jgi:PAS domain S-box-containing protein